MHTNQQQIHTPEPVLPREEDVHAYLLHHLSQVQRIAGTSPAKITLGADTFSDGNPRVGWNAFIYGVTVTSLQSDSAADAVKNIAERAAACTASKVAALRAEADELERGLNS